MIKTNNWSQMFQGQRRTAVKILSISTVLAFVVLAYGYLGGFRVNTTPSEPLGLWRIVPFDGPVAIDDVVFVCPPDNPTMREARNRGYMRAGLCPGDVGPLIKTVIALEGQRVEIGPNVRIDGEEIENSRLVLRDGKGRPLRPYRGGVVPSRNVFLHSDFVASWDSRYFGPIPVSGIIGFAREVLTIAP